MSTSPEAPPGGDASGELLLAADALLRIDVEAQIRKLAGAQLASDAQLVIECVRFALGRGATRVEVELGPQSATLQIHEWRLDRQDLEFAVALRQQALAASRGRAIDGTAAQRALTQLESSGALPWLVIAGTPRLACTLESPTRSGPVRLRIDAQASTVRDAVPPHPASSRWHLAGLELDRKRARQQILEALRFAAARVQIDRLAPPPPFANALDVFALPTGRRSPGSGDDATDLPLPGSLAMSRELEAPRVWITRHGVLAAHLTAARGPGFELAVEVGDRLGPRATGADLRALGEAALPGAMHAFVDRLATLAEQRRPPGERRRLALLALQGIQIGEHARALAQLPVFDRIDASGARSRATLVDLRAAVAKERGRGRLVALRPDDDPTQYELAGGAVILDDALRAQLSSRLELDIQAPPLRPSSQSWAERWRRSYKGALEKAADLFAGMRGAPPAIAFEDLTTAEHTLLDALRSIVGDAREVQLCDGAMDPRWSRTRLLLGRAHPVVRAAIARCSADPAWAYPAALAICEGRVPATPLRKRWRASSWMRAG